MRLLAGSSPFPVQTNHTHTHTLRTRQLDDGREVVVAAQAKAPQHRAHALRLQASLGEL
jgi:hypothetical protein